MMAPDLHPEELLDGAAAGTLSPDEQTRLDGHLAACPACRFELKARADFAALPMPAMAVDELVTRALAGMPSASIANQAQVPPARRRRFSPGVLAAAVMFLGAASFAAVGAGLVRPIAVLLGIAKPEAITPPVPPPAPVIHQRISPKPSVEAPPPPEEAVVEPPSQPPLVVAPSLAPKHIEKLSPPPAPPEPVVTAQELFKLATQARSEGRRLDAEQTYRELTTRFPQSAEANVAHAVMGRLLLDLGRPADALVELDAALASGDGSLREDALANRALAFDAQADDAKAAAAWSQLLSEFPASIHAKRAKERLEALNAP
jgi:TolA-binding protein